MYMYIYVYLGTLPAYYLRVYICVLMIDELHVFNDNDHWKKSGPPIFL